MKTPIYPMIATVLCMWHTSSPADAQEEQLNAAVKAQEKQQSSASKLADRIQNFGFLDYARKLVDRLEKKERKIDPFGMPMDPEQKGAELLAIPSEVPGEDVPKTSLQEAVSKFRVSGVFPSRKEVMVGAQTLKEGDNVVIKHGDTSFNLRITKVESNSVELIDTDTGETAGVSLGGIVQELPAGMTLTRPVVQRQPGTANEDGSIVPMSRFLTLE